MKLKTSFYCALLGILFYAGLVFSSCHNCARAATFTVSGDRGGFVIAYALNKDKLETSKTSVKFDGNCASACTLYLGLSKSQICITKNASFSFHLPYGATTEAGNKWAEEFMLVSYPSWVKQWLNDNGGLTHELKTMDYSVASRHLATCKGAA